MSVKCNIDHVNAVQVIQIQCEARQSITSHIFHRQISVSGTPETTVAEPISLNPGDFWDNLRIIKLEGQNFIDYLGTNFIAGWLDPIR